MALRSNGQTCWVCDAASVFSTIARPPGALLFRCPNDHLWLDYDLPASPHGVEWDDA